MGIDRYPTTNDLLQIQRERARQGLCKGGMRVSAKGKRLRPVRRDCRLSWGAHPMLYRGDLMIGSLNGVEGSLVEQLWTAVVQEHRVEPRALSAFLAASDSMADMRPSTEEMQMVEPDGGPLTAWWAAYDQLRATDRIERNGRCDCRDGETCGEWYCRAFGQQSGNSGELQS